MVVEATEGEEEETGITGAEGEAPSLKSAKDSNHVADLEIEHGKTFAIIAREIMTGILCVEMMIRSLIGAVTMSAIGETHRTGQTLETPLAATQLHPLR